MPRPVYSRVNQMLRSAMPSSDAVRIYVYDISEFPVSLRQAPCCVYSPASGVLAYIAAHPDVPWLVSDPSKATHFLLPILGACRWNAAGDEAGMAYMLAALDFVGSRWPYLAARGGADHILDVTWPDNDRCRFNQSMQARFRPFIGLSVFGDTRPEWANCHIQGQDILMPHNCYEVNPETDFDCTRAVQAFGTTQSHRTRLAVFRGTLHGTSIRPPMVAALANESGFLVAEGHIDWEAHFNEMRHSVFVLVPAAIEMATARLWVAVENGAIPVIISDHLRMPFDEAVGASGVAVIVRWSELPVLAKSYGTCLQQK